MKGKSKKVKVAESEKPITKADIKLTSLDELKDETLGKVGSSDRDAYEDELKNELANLAANDTTTEPRASNPTAPASDQKYGAELAKAIEHITQGKSIKVDWSTEGDDGIQTGVDKLVIVGDVEHLVPGLREVGYILSQADTKYLRIAVRYAQDQTLKNTLLVFHRSV